MQGHVDLLSADLITGWAHCPNRPGQRVLVNVHIGGKPVGNAIAEHFRADLLTAGIGDGWKAFYFDPRRFILGENIEVTISYASSGHPIPNGTGRLSNTHITNTLDWDVSHQGIMPPQGQARLSAYDQSLWPTFQICPVIDGDSIEPIDRSISSLLAQSYTRWELCLCGQSALSPILCSYFSKLASSDGRVRFPVTHAACPHRSDAVFRASLVMGDILEPEALLEAAVCILEHPETEAVYFDHDRRDDAGELIDTLHKPAWSPVYFLGTGYAGSFLIIKAAIQGEKTETNEFECAPTLDQLLIQKPASTVQHIPRVLFHQRVSAQKAAWRASMAQDCIGQLSLPIRAANHPTLPNRVQLFPAIAKLPPKISIIIPTRDAPRCVAACLRSIYELTTYQNFEVVIADNGTTDPEALRHLAAHPIIWLKDPNPFNFSQLNNRAVRQAFGDVLVFLNNDTEVITPDWLQIMLAHLELPDVGVVGPLLLYPDNTVQHAGMVLGLRGTAGHVMQGYPADCDGYHGSLACSREVSAVTGACLMISRKLFNELGGFDEYYRLVYQDVDLCLRAREKGKSTLYAANARLTHAESATRGPEYDHADRTRFLARWSSHIAAGDPFYHPSFTRNRSDYCLR